MIKKLRGKSYIRKKLCGCKNPDYKVLNIEAKIKQCQTCGRKVYYGKGE